MAYIRLNCMNLADAAKRLQMAGEVRAPHRDADAILPLRQPPHHVPTEKPGAAENGDQRIGIGFYCHRCPASRDLPAPTLPHARGREWCTANSGSVCDCTGQGGRFCLASPVLLP